MQNQGTILESSKQCRKYREGTETPYDCSKGWIKHIFEEDSTNVQGWAYQSYLEEIKSDDRDKAAALCDTWKYCEL